MTEENPESKPQKTLFQEDSCDLKHKHRQRCYRERTRSKGHHIQLKERMNGILEQSQEDTELIRHRRLPL